MFSVDNNWYIFLKHVRYTWDDFNDFSMVLLTPCFWFLGVVRRNLKKNECRWTFCCNFASSYLWWIKEEERLEKSQTTNIHLFEAILFYAAKLLNCWPYALVLSRTTSTGSTCILLRNIFIIQNAWFRQFPKKGKICLRTNV